MERISEVRLFIRVVDLGSFTKAAAEAGIGQPAATKQIVRLEQQLGARLLHRTTQGISPTEVGLLYYEKCKIICHQADEATSIGSLLQTQPQGSIRVSSSVAFGRRVLAPIVMEFMRMNPRLQIDLNCDDRYVDLVEQGVDVAIRMGRLADSSLGAAYLGANPWVLVASPGYLQRKGLPKVPSDLSEHDALVYSSVQGDHRWHFSAGGGKQTSVRIRWPLRSNSLSMILDAACNDFGIAALPHYVAHSALQSGTIIPILETWKLPHQEVHAVYPSPRLVPAKVKLFITWLESRFTPNWWQEVKS